MLLTINYMINIYFMNRGYDDNFPRFSLLLSIMIIMGAGLRKSQAVYRSL
jgi:hypothetical protein